MADETKVTPEVKQDEEYIKENTWKDSSLFTVLSQFLRNPTALVGFAVIFILLLCSIFAPLICRFSPYAVAPIDQYQFPNRTHLFGTDNLGRDLFARIMYGARSSLSLGLGSSLFGAVVGIILGTMAGYLGGMADNLIMRFCDVIQNIPDTLLAICVSQALGGGLIPTLIALSVTSIPGLVRLLRATMMSIRDQEFVEAATAINCSKPTIMFSHVLPNCLSPIIVSISMGTGGKILQSAGLSYIGLGVQEPLAEWGAMISAGKTSFMNYPYIVLLPGVFIMLVVLSFNLLGDGLRDALDPKQRS